MITWDEKKRQRVIKDHGVDFAKIEDAFRDPSARRTEHTGAGKNGGSP